MPWYELRVRGRLGSSSRLVPGFHVVEQVVTTVLTGRVEGTADIQPILAEVQALGLDVVEFHQVPERPVAHRGPRAAALPRQRAPEAARIELVVLELPGSRVPQALARVLNRLADDELVEVVDVAHLTRLPDGTLERRATIAGMPKRLQWQLSRRGRWTVPVEVLAEQLPDLTPEQVVLAVALRLRSPVDRLQTAAGLSGGSLLASLTVPAPQDDA